jgi:hypothetical protein
LWKYSQQNPKKNPFFAVFIDAASPVQNVASSSHLDPSLQRKFLDMEMNAKDFFCHWIVRGTFEFLFRYQVENLVSLLNSDMYLRAGRPLLSVLGRLGQVEEQSGTQLFVKKALWR